MHHVVVAAQDARQERLLLIGPAVGDQRRAHLTVGEPHRRDRRAGRDQLLGDDQPVDRRTALTTELGRPRETDPAERGELLGELLREAVDPRVVVAPVPGDRVARHLPRLLTECLLLGRPAEFHDRDRTAGSPRAKSSHEPSATLPTTSCWLIVSGYRRMLLTMDRRPSLRSCWPVAARSPPACGDDARRPTDRSGAITHAAPRADARLGTAAVRRRPPPSEPRRRRPSRAAPTTHRAEDRAARRASLVAVPTQNREDPAKNQFQVQIHNGTRERYDLAGVQFRWAGYTTPMTERDSIIVGGQIIDFPVPFPGATCVGDGLDRHHALGRRRPRRAAARRRQRGRGAGDRPVAPRPQAVPRGLREADDRVARDDRVGRPPRGASSRAGPVTAGELRLTRRAGTGEITILSVSNTIPYEFAAVDTAVGEPVAVLADGADEVSVPVRFIESRCDPHALAEIKQPTKFVAQVQLGDGSRSTPTSSIPSATTGSRCASPPTRRA